MPTKRTHEGRTWANSSAFVIIIARKTRKRDEGVFNIYNPKMDSPTMIEHAMTESRDIVPSHDDF